MSFLQKIFGDSNAHYIQSLAPLVQEINNYESEMKDFSNNELRGLTEKFRGQLTGGNSLDDVLPEAFAIVREAARRTLNQRHFDVQLVGGIVLHQGKIAEMRTGEGKTLVATLPIYLNALEGKGVHLVTPNDYLSRIGAGWMGPVYHVLGMRAAAITHETSGIYDPEYTDSNSHADPRLSHFRPCSRREAYLADITYGTNNEFGFDYLRDNLEYIPENLRQREHHFAIIDEIDSILIDEARTPLIISAPDEESAELYQVFAGIVPQLKENIDYNVDEKLRAVAITEDGINKIEKILGIGNIYEDKGIRFVRHLESSLRAQALFHRDRDYVVKDGEVIIVDEFTGRMMPGRRWSEGLHQAVEAKEKMRVQQESRTLATITFQNYFRMYKKIAGMTGTAQTSAEEFHRVYGLDVITIPTNRPMVRQDFPDFVFRTEDGKLRAVAREVKKRHEKGQPVLIGTVSISKNERLSKILQVEGVPHEILNAKNHEREALIIAEAGKKGAVTVATNMAGRGVDIILGMGDKKEWEDVRRVGGLHVIGTERHEARRIDNQLRGRAGRQGDPGSSQFFLSLEDDLMRIFGSDKIKRMMESFGIPEDQPIEHKIVSRAIESAQGKIEGFHFDTRKQVLEYDDVLNKQRDAIYRMRREILFSERDSGESTELKDRIYEMLAEEIATIVAFHTQNAYVPDWNIEEILENIKSIADVSESALQKIRDIAADENSLDEKRDLIKEYAIALCKEVYKAREKEMGFAAMRNIKRAVLLRAIDILWMDHLDQMDHLHDSVRLRAYGQRDPLVEYKHEGVRLFRELQGAIRAQVVHTIFKFGSTLQKNPDASRHIEMKKPEADDFIGGGSVETLAGNARTPTGDKEPNRNDPCWCGSGKKYKRCHLNSTS